MSTGYEATDPDFDWTGGAPIPGMGDDVEIPPEPAEIDISSIDLSGGEAFDVDAAQVEATAASREFRDIPPGDHLLKVVKLDKVKQEFKPAWVNGQQTNYETYTGLVRFCLATDPQSTIGMFIVLPPPPSLYPGDAKGYKAALHAYVHGLTKADGKEPGWHAGVFGQFVAKVIGDYDPTRPLPVTHNPANWAGKLVWGTVEMQRQAKGDVRLNPATGEPYPPRLQLKSHAFRRHIPGQPDPNPRGKSPVPAAPARQTKAQLASNMKAQIAREKAAAGASPNGAASLADAGLDNV